jgi:hypothetical protein
MTCPDDGAQAQNGLVESLWNSLAPAESELTVDAALAYAHYRETHELRPTRNTQLLRWLKGRQQPLWGALAAAAAFALLLSFAPARTWGQRILAMLRVQKVAVVPIDMSALEHSRDTQAAGKLLAQMISDNVVVTLKPGEPQVASSTDAASQMAGFAVKDLAALGSPQKISVEDEAAFHMTLNRDRIQDLIEQAGRFDIQIPASIDGSTFAVHVPKGVRLSYGSCSADKRVPNEKPGAIHRGAPTAVSEDCISFMQIPSPVLSVPPTLNLSTLAEAGLQIAGMNAADAHAFCQSVDWSSTLVIPVPQNGSSVRSVSVDGVNGTLVETAPHGRVLGEYALIWVKGGIVYALNGVGTPDRAVEAASSLN